MTLSEVTKQLEAAVSVVDKKRADLESAKLVAQAAATAYGEAVNLVKSLHEEYSKFMSAVLTNHGQLHK